LDSRLLDIIEGSLAESIGRGDRVPGGKVFVAQRQGGEDAVGRLAVPVIAPPFTAERIERLAEKVLGAGRKARGDAA